MAGATSLGLLMRQRPFLSPAIRLFSKSPSSSFATVSRSIRPGLAAPQRQLVRRRFPSRSYADAAPKPSPKKRGTFRTILIWSWRLTYGSFFVGLGYVGYGIYDMRFPADQSGPDPSKKTLVILGKFTLSVCRIRAYQHRHWMGSCFSPQEIGY